MYKKALCSLVLGSSLFLACCLCVKGLNYALLYEKPVEILKLELSGLEEKAKAQGIGEASGEGLAEGDNSTSLVEGGLGIAGIAVSGPPVVACTKLEQSVVYDLSDEDLEVLLRIVEAEAGCEDEEGKLLVANVILNRMENEAFPDTVTDVVFQRENGVSQFSPVTDGRYYEVIISKETIHAVSRALRGEDISNGALYFAAREYADSERMKWFDEKLTYLFEHGGHEFFK